MMRRSIWRPLPFKPVKMPASSRFPMSRLPHLAKGWLLVAAPLLLATAGARLCAQEVPADRLESYLLRLGLADLHVRHLENAAASETNKDARLAAGRKLADAYAERLMSVADEDAAYKQLKERVDRLLTQTPDAVTPALTVMLLQADFQRAESLVNSWLDEPTGELPPEAAAILTRIVPQLEQRVKEINGA